MATKFIEAGTGATFGFEFWTSVFNSVTSDSITFNTAPRSIKCDSATGLQSRVRKDSILADAGTRISFFINFTNFDTFQARNPNCICFNSGGTEVVAVRTTPAGVLKITVGGSEVGSGSTLSTGIWYRLCLAYVRTSSTVNEIRLYLNGNIDISTTNVTMSNGSSVNLQLGWVSTPAANKILNIDDIYVDDSSSLTDTGDIRVTAKLPNAENVNDFDTAIGNARGASDFNNVNERALSETNGWRHNALTAVNENYGLQNASAGDVDITGATIVVRKGWIWAKHATGAISFITSASNQSKTAGTSLVLTVPIGGWATGSSVIITFACDDTAGTYSVADTALNTYTQDATITNSGDVITKVFSTHNISALAAGDTITITHPSLTARAAIAANFTGLATSSVLDLSLVDTDTDNTPSYNNATTDTTQADEVIIGAYGGEGPNGDVWGDDTTLSDEEIIAQIGTTTGGAASNITAFMMYRIVSSIGKHDTDATISTARDSATALVSYKANISAGTPKITNNGTDTAITLTTTSSLFTNIVDSASYPSNAAGIGMISGGGGLDTYLYECGMLIAYTPAAVGGTYVNSYIGPVGYF